MSEERISQATRILGAIVGGSFLILGVAELVTRLDQPLPLLFWLPTLWGGGAGSRDLDAMNRSEFHAGCLV